MMQRYWEWLVGRVPSWIAPNLITIIGLATNVFTTLVLVYYCPTATEQVSHHTLYWAVFILKHIKQTMIHADTDCFPSVSELQRSPRLDHVAD